VVSVLKPVVIVIFLINSIKPMQEWLAEGLPPVSGNTMFHECGDGCSCKLEKI
jgi:hypothetical protein